MKKSYTLLLILFVANSLFAQSEALELVKLLNSKELTNRLSYFNEIKKSEKPSEANPAQTIENDLYQKLSVVYQELFTLEQIANMLTFYNSVLGKKILENQPKIYEKTRPIIKDWEMKQRGIPQEETVDPSFKNEEQILALRIKELEKSKLSKKVEAPKIVKVPKINNLEELKKLLIDNPHLVDNPMLFEEILGKQEFEKLHSPKY